jgi:hypothetical protein
MSEPLKSWVNPEDIKRMTEALNAFRAYEWWIQTENPTPEKRCLSPLVMQNMKLGLENGTLEPSMHQYKNLLATAMFFENKCRQLLAEKTPPTATD